MPKNEFTITFWIRSSQNPKWSDLNSVIRFPPSTTQDGVIVFVTKYEEYLKVFVLDPEIGSRKIKVEIKDYIGKDTFVALVVNGDLSTLYLNAKVVMSVNKDSMERNIEIGDFVMVSIKDGELAGVKIGDNVSVIMPAEVTQILGDNGSFYFMGLNQSVVLPKNRIHF